MRRALMGPAVEGYADDKFRAALNHAIKPTPVVIKINFNHNPHGLLQAPFCLIRKVPLPDALRLCRAMQLLFIARYSLSPSHDAASLHRPMQLNFVGRCFPAVSPDEKGRDCLSLVGPGGAGGLLPPRHAAAGDSLAVDDVIMEFE